MKNRISSVFILFLLLFTNSCMDLDKEPLDMISSDAVFKDEALSEAISIKYMAICLVDMACLLKLVRMY